MKALSWIALSWAIALPAVAQKSSSKPPAYTPEQAAARMTLPDGFKGTQFAAEPHVVQPFAFCFDSRGRVWVCENLSMSYVLFKHLQEPLHVLGNMYYINI